MCVEQVGAGGCQESMVMTSSEESTESSHLTLTNLILVSLVAGTGLFIVNTVILVSLCYKRSGPRLAPRWDRAGGDRAESSSTECLSSSRPTTPHLLPTFNTPGRTSSIHAQSVPLSSFPQAVQECGPAKYRTYSSGGSYVGLGHISPSLPPPADGAGYSSVPLVADIPAPGAFSGHGIPGKEESITC